MTLLPLHLVVNWPVYTILFYTMSICVNVCILYYSMCLSLFVCLLFILSVFTAIWRINVFINAYFCMCAPANALQNLGELSLLAVAVGLY